MVLTIGSTADSYSPRRTVASEATAGIITTAAGNGIVGYGGDGGPAPSASVENSDGVAADAQGNLFIADSSQQSHPPRGCSKRTITTVVGIWPWRVQRRWGACHERHLTRAI